MRVKKLAIPLRAVNVWKCQKMTQPEGGLECWVTFALSSLNFENNISNNVDTTESKSSFAIWLAFFVVVVVLVFPFCWLFCIFILSHFKTL